LQGNTPATANTASTIALRDANGNVSANFFIGNGSQLTGINTSTTSITNGNSNVNIPAANGNVNISAVGNANILIVTGTGANINGTLRVTGNLDFTGAKANLSSNGNIIITGGSSGYVLSTDGAGNLSWVAQSAGGVASISNGTSNINIATSGGNITMGVGGTAGVVTVTTTGISNTRINVRTANNGATTSGAITPTADTSDQYNLVGLTGTVSINVPSGTFTDGQKLTLRIKDDGTARTLSWTTTGANSYRIIGVVLPAITTANKVLYVGCVYNSQDVYWDVVAVTQQA
jgi:hypothetical protein